MRHFDDIFQKLNSIFLNQFGFNLWDVRLSRITVYLHNAKDSSSLAITRILFGLAMLFDIPDERGGSVMDQRWGDPYMCHFPLLPFLQPLAMPYMAAVYACLWFGALGIMLGYKYRISVVTFTLCYWYIFLIEKSFWNNHSYLFGIVAFLLAWCDASCFWSIDAYINPSQRRETVPYWNYFILKYQFFILYFVAGLKKGTAEWLSGYSLPNLSEHWVFDPFKLFLSVPQIDYLIVHWFAFIFDLTIAFWMMWSRTRNLAMPFCAAFHLMNIRLFRIGMFPWVCLATMPLFYSFDWPKVVLKRFREFTEYFFRNGCFIYRKLFKYFGYKLELMTEMEGNGNAENEKSADGPKDFMKGQSKEIHPNKSDSNEKTVDGPTDSINGQSEEMHPTKNELNENCNELDNKNKIMEKQENTLEEKSTTIKKKLTTLMIIFFVFLELFLPYSHFITKGYNNWTNGLYGYSWDMMVHTWESHSIVIKVVDNDSGNEFYLDPFLWTPNDRWTRHGDMLIQYSHCIQKNVMPISCKKDGVEMKNISVYADIWFSMNNRFLQRMFDPKVDLLKAEWAPFKETPWLMPLLNDNVWRHDLDKIEDGVYAWENQSDVLFVADFPGYYYENYMPFEFTNVTLTVLKGQVSYETEVAWRKEGQSHILNPNDQIQVVPGFHKVTNIADGPANYMYTFVNVKSLSHDVSNDLPKLPFATEVTKRFKNMFKFFWITTKSVWSIINSECF